MRAITWRSALFHRRGVRASHKEPLRHSVEAAEAFSSFPPPPRPCPGFTHLSGQRAGRAALAHRWAQGHAPVPGSARHLLTAPVEHGPFSGVLPSSAQQNLTRMLLGLREALFFSPQPDRQKLEATEGELNNCSPRMETVSSGKSLQVSFTCPWSWWL